jgi:nifR3 family TIM-barrel protein
MAETKHTPLKIKIGSVTLENPTVLAPLAGITNLPFRLLMKAAGCALVCSEMISSNGLIYNSQRTLQLLCSTLQEKPLSIQIFGSDPAIMADAAAMVESSGADILDINFGCSVKKVVKTGAGAALMRAPEKAERILKAVRKAVKIPVTIKIRSGWDKSADQAVTMAKIAEASGVDAIAVHPRTATQGFRGAADWSVIAAIKNLIAIPVIGNGDIVKPDDAVAMRNATGCDGVMIGRIAIGNPWIFSQTLSRFRNQPILPVDLASRFTVMVRYVRLSVKHSGEKPACYMMRSRLGWFVKGLPHSSSFRESIKHISSEGEALERIDAYRHKLMQQVHRDDPTLFSRNIV